MITIWIVALLGIVAAWILLWFLRLREWGVAAPVFVDLPIHALSISCIIPARNEAANIGACLESLRGQGNGSMELVVVDDGSTDDTAQWARNAREQDPRIRLIPAAPRPESWSGKTWALTQGVNATSGEWLLFCDADTVLDPALLATAVNVIQHENLDCFSVIPQMKATRLSVSVLLSCLSLARAILLRPASPGKRGMVQGAFLVIRRSSFNAVAGFESLRGSLLEDVELGHLLHDAGCRVRTLPSSPLIMTTMYTSFSEAWQGICKHLYPVMGYSIGRMLLSTLAYVGLVVFPLSTFVVAIGLAIRAPVSEGSMTLALAALLAIGVMYGVMRRILDRESLARAALILAPLSFLLFSALALHSIHAYTHGQVMWKGRHYVGNRKSFSPRMGADGHG